MYQSLGQVALKSGERVEAGVIDCPDAEWASRIEALLGHKGESWRWQNRSCARENLSIDARYYLLHRDGEPFANMLTATHRGVGHFGHVFTIPEERRKGAAHQLMGLLMEDFRQRDGLALFLGTRFDSPAYHIYRRHGFEGFAPGSGQMEYYADGDAEGFRQEYFAASGQAQTGPPQWRHWPASGTLFTATFPGVVRCPSLGLTGRASTEGPFVAVLRRAARSLEDKVSSYTVISERAETGAVVAVARCSAHPLWSSKLLVDLYGHPDAEQEMVACVSALESVTDAPCVSYSDGNQAREAALTAVGFKSGPNLPEWIPDFSGDAVDVTVWHRE
jgi:GNAT superfamily N-acetyltransferase